MASPPRSPRPRDLRLQEYLAFARQRPDLFDVGEGGIRILLDSAEIEQVEDDVTIDLRRRGLSETGAEIGIIAKDPWFWLIRDAVEFPDGARRAYARFINRTGHGSAVLPLFEDRVMLTRQFRHAIRRWSLEIPRGGIEIDKTPDETAIAEVREEIGGEITELVPLGFVHGSTNIYYNGVYLYFARLSRIGAPQLSEGIISIEQPTVAEFERMLRDNEVTDSFTISAYFQAKLRGLV
ncbi:MAG TPA: NUDIX hydrolase [Alphaproteobacteria bacterium]